MIHVKYTKIQVHYTIPLILYNNTVLAYVEIWLKDRPWNGHFFLNWGLAVPICKKTSGSKALHTATPHLTVIETGISFDKQYSYKAWNHMTVLLSGSNSHKPCLLLLSKMLMCFHLSASSSIDCLWEAGKEVCKSWLCDRGTLW